jgi:very-short-patch-repair endonuclease
VALADAIRKATKGESPWELALSRQCVLIGLPTPARQVRFDAERRWKFDLAWPAQLVACEVDGATYADGRHNRGDGIHNDCEKFSTAAAQGWRVLRVDAKMVEDGSAVRLIERALSLQMPATSPIVTRARSGRPRMRP